MESTHSEVNRLENSNNEERFQSTFNHEQTLQFTLNGVLFEDRDLYMADVANLPEHQLRFEVRPNPTGGPLTVELPTAIPSGQLIVRDLLGRAVFSQELGELTRVKMDLSTLPAGLYQATFSACQKLCEEQKNVSVSR